MNGNYRMPRLDHRSLAARLKAAPQFEQQVASEDDKARAQRIAAAIRHGSLAAYQPKGSFQARWAPSPGRTGWTVYACYIGDPTTREAA